MVNVGSMSIKGGLDTSVVERGFNRIKNGFREVAKFGKSVTSDLSRMATESKRLANAFSAVGIIGAGAFINLAKGAPAVAAVMAIIGIETDRLQRALGTALAPAFEKFAGIYTKFINFVEAHPDLTAAFTLGSGAITGIGIVGGILGFGVAASVLTALGLLSLIGVAAFAGLVAVSKASERNLPDTYSLGSIPYESGPGGLISFIKDRTTMGRKVDPSLEGTEDFDKRDLDLNFLANNPILGRIDATQEKDRRFFLLELWDNVWS